MRSLCVRLHPIIVIVTAEPGRARTLRSGSCSGGKHSVRELALPSKLKWWVLLGRRNQGKLFKI
jgi:hypothetical protein